MNRLCIGAAFLTCFCLLYVAATRRGDARYFNDERISLSLGYRNLEMGFNVSFEAKADEPKSKSTIHLSIRDLLLM